MQRIQLAEDLQFSRVIHGLWRLNEWNYSDAELLSLIEWCIDHGITTFDHADIYGGYTCEKLFGNALALSPGLRENIELVKNAVSFLNRLNGPLTDRIIITQANRIFWHPLSNRL